MDTKTLRRKILDLAIQGRLVPQDPSDEPAAVLLDRINPKTKIISQYEQFPQLPDGWAVTSISDVCDNINGLWKGKKEPFVHVGVIRNANFTKDFKLDFSNIEYLYVEKQAFTKRHLMHGDLIVEKSGGSDKNPVGRAILYEGDDNLYSFSNFTMVLRIRHRNVLTSKYLYYYLLSLYQKGLMISMQTHTTGLHNLIMDKYLAIQIPLPPLAEQQRIVAKVEEVLSVVERYEKAQDELDALCNSLNGRLRKSILQEAIQGRLVPQDPSDEPAAVLLDRIRAEKARLVKEGKLKKTALSDSVIFRGEDNKYYERSGKTVTCIDDQIPFEIPEGWEWCRLKNICTFLSRGKSPKYSEISRQYPVFAQKCNLKEGGISLSQARFLDPSTISKWDDVYKLRNGDVLVNSTGTGTVGRVRLFNENCLGNYPFVVPDSHVSVVRTVNEIASEFVLAYLSSKHIQQYFEDNLAGSTNQKELYIGILEDLLLPLPPLAEQRRIVAKVEEVLSVVERYEKAQDELDALCNSLNGRLRKSILQEAIQGRLVPQDPSDEPAAVLLDRIRAEKARLVKEGKLKKSALSDSVIFRAGDNKYYERSGKTVTCIDDQIPFEIPEGWEWVRIKDIFQINPKNEADDSVLSAFVPMEKIQATYGSEFSYDKVLWKNIKKGFTHFADGDVAFAKITPCFQNRKSAVFYDLPNGIGAGTTELKVLRQYGNTIDPWYLLYFLETSYFIEKAKFKGTANQQRIASGYLEDKLFPLPSLAEQRRIVAKVEELFAVLDRMEGK